MEKVPRRFQEFMKSYPSVGDAYEKLGAACHSSGTLDDKQRALVKLAISIGARLEGAVHSHVRKALKAEIQPDQIRHTVLLSLPTVGLPSMMAAMSWVDDILPTSTTRAKKG